MDHVMESPYLSILIIGTVITLISIITLLYQIYVIDLNKAEILSLYALLQLAEIQNVYNECDGYMQMLDEASILKAIGHKDSEQ